MELPPWATKEDFERCKKTISNLVKNETDLDEITLTIMNISYSKGGDYSERIIFEFAKSYLNLLT